MRFNKVTSMLRLAFAMQILADGPITTRVFSQSFKKRFGIGSSWGWKTKCEKLAMQRAARQNAALVDQGRVASLVAVVPSAPQTVPPELRPLVEAMQAAAKRNYMGGFVHLQIEKGGKVSIEYQLSPKTTAVKGRMMVG